MTSPDLQNAQRLFVAVRLAPSAANQLATIGEQLARRAQQYKLAVRWALPINYHVTLAFLGWARPEAFAAVEDVVAQACAKLDGFDFRISGLGGFPAVDGANVVWAGVEDNGQLAQLAADIAHGCRELGFSIDPRPFVPHVTLGRLAAPESISELILPWREQMFSTSVVSLVEVLDSSAKSDGYAYKQVAKIVLETAKSKAKSLAQRQTRSVQHEAQNALEPQTEDGWPKHHHPN